MTTRTSRRTIAVPELPASVGGFSTAIAAGGFIFPSGLFGSDLELPFDRQVATPKPGRPFDDDAVKLQSRVIYRRLDQILAAGNSSLDHIVRLDQFILDRANASGYLEARNEFLLRDRPASTLVVADDLPVPKSVIEVDAIAVAPSSIAPRVAINSDRVSFNVGGGYSQAIVAGDWVFCAGAMASDNLGAAAYPGAPGTGLAPDARINPNYWYGSEIKAQTVWTVRDKLKYFLEAAGSSLENVVRAQVYLFDFETDYAGFQEAWRELFPNQPPSTTVVPMRQGSPTGGRVEISLIALKNGSQLPRRPISGVGLSEPIGHAPVAVQAGQFLFFSTLIASTDGMSGSDREDRAFPYDTRQGKREMQRLLEQAGRICRTAGTDLGCIVKCWAFFTDMLNVAPALEVWSDAFRDDPPAGTIVGVPAPLAVPGRTIALDLIGYLGD